MENLKLVEEFYDKDKTKIKSRYYVDEDGFKQGIYEHFYENGNLAARNTYVNNIMHGISENFDPDNGYLSSVTAYKVGKQYGLKVSINSDGTVHQFLLYS